MVESLSLKRPDDFHVHLRDGDMLRSMAKFTADHFARALVMPNLTPPVLTGADALAYKGRILEAVGAPAGWFKPLMTIKITDQTTPEIIEEAKKAGVIAGKVYPVGVTTNSDDGVRDFGKLDHVFETMQEVGMVLCIHGETPGVYTLEREADFIWTKLTSLRDEFKDLRIVLEHVSTSQGVDYVRKHENIAATITVHHLFLTLDDVIGDKLQVHNFCKPIAKTEHDRRALVEAATSGDSKFFLGTDSAPHIQRLKECDACAAGVFTAPVALPLLVEVFEARKSLHNLERFTSENGAFFYGLPRNEGTIRLVKEPWTIPTAEIGPLTMGKHDVVVPFRAGQPLQWRVA